TAAGPGLPRAPPSTWTTSFMEAGTLADVGRREVPGNPRAATVAHLPVVGVRTLARGAPAAVTPATVDDDLHVGIVLVVLRELVVELVCQLLRDDAVDHRDDVNLGECERIPCPARHADPTA